MEQTLIFVLNSVLLGVGLAMDAFSVSLANGLHDPQMKKLRMNEVAGVFAGFQFAMPLIGWLCVHTVVRYFQAFEGLIPWIALLLLALIGGKMLTEGLHSQDTAEETPKLGAGMLLMQGVATSIDALSVGFTIAGYGLAMACAACLIIAAVTYMLCMAGLVIGRKFGTRLSGKAQILGGVILIVIGVETFVRGIF